MFFESWTSLFQVIFKAVFIYIALIVVLRISGKRVLSKMNAFDIVIAFSFGSILARVALAKDVKIVDGLAALLIFVGLHHLASWLTWRSRPFSVLVKGEPRLLVFKGKFMHATMRKEKVTEAEVRSALRAKGLSDMDKVLAVVLENDGAISVVGKDDGQQPYVLEDVRE